VRSKDDERSRAFQDNVIKATVHSLEQPSRNRSSFAPPKSDGRQQQAKSSMPAPTTTPRSKEKPKRRFKPASAPTPKPAPVAPTGPLSYPNTTRPKSGAPHRGKTFFRGK
jgi:hypothetical protein